MSIDVVIAVWSLRIVGVVGVVAISVVIAMACLNYVYHSGKHATVFFKYLVARRGKNTDAALVAALGRELKLLKTLDNVRVKFGNEAVEDSE